MSKKVVPILAEKEYPIRVFKATGSSGYGECAICGYWICERQLMCITSRLREVHAGCLAYQEVLRQESVKGTQKLRIAA